MPAFCYPVLKFRSAVGWCGIVGRDDHVVYVTLGHKNESAAWRAISSFCTEIDASPDPHAVGSWLDLLASRFEAYGDGKRDDFRDIKVSLDGLTPFRKKVLLACRTIPYARTISYAGLAARCGAPRAARAVGGAMAGNPIPLIIPCHRVVGQGGKLGGFSAPGGVATKRKLLALESGAASREERHVATLA